MRLGQLTFGSILTLIASASSHAEPRTDSTCSASGIATLGIVSYSAERNSAEDGEPLPVPDTCLGSGGVDREKRDRFIERVRRLHEGYAHSLFGVDFATLFPEGIHLLVVTDTPGAELVSSALDPISTTLNPGRELNS